MVHPAPVGRDDYAELEATKEGFLPKRIHVPVAVRKLQVRLEEPATIRGRVRMPDGGPPDRPITVVAWSATLTRVPPESSYEEILLSGMEATRGPFLVAHALPDGTFEVVGADPSTHWLVSAGGVGVLCPAVEVALPGAMEVDLAAGFVYVAVVDFRDSRGGSPRLPASSSGSRRAFFWCDDAEAEVTLLTRLGELLAGFRREREQEPPLRKVVAFTAPTDKESVGPCHLEHMLPGFPKTSVEFRASSLALGPTFVDVLFPEAVFEGGTVSIEPFGASEAVVLACARAGRLRPGLVESRLELREESGRTEVYGILLDLQRPIRVEDVPVGTYHVGFESMGQHARFPRGGLDALRIEVRPGQSTSIPLDFSDFGALIVSLVDEEGFELDGWARFALGEGEPLENGGRLVMKGGMQSFAQGPYLVGVLPAGAYTLQGFEPAFGMPADALGYVPVSIEAGVESTVQIRVQRQ